MTREIPPLAAAYWSGMRAQPGVWVTCCYECEPLHDGEPGLIMVFGDEDEPAGVPAQHKAIEWMNGHTQTGHGSLMIADARALDGTFCTYSAPKGLDPFSVHGIGKILGRLY